MVYTHLWSSLGQCSASCGHMAKESPLLAHPETMVSFLFGRSRLFPWFPPSQMWCTSPLQAVFMQPTPVLSLGSDRWSLSLSSQPPATPVGEQTSLSAWWVLVGTYPLCGNLSALPSAPLLLCSPPRLGSFPPTQACLCQWRGFLVCGNFSSFTAPSQRCRSHPYSFVSVFFFFLLSYSVTWGFSCLLGSLMSSASIQ